MKIATHKVRQNIPNLSVGACRTIPTADQDSFDMKNGTPMRRENKREEKRDKEGGEKERKRPERPLKATGGPLRPPELRAP